MAIGLTSLVAIPLCAVAVAKGGDLWWVTFAAGWVILLALGARSYLVGVAYELEIDGADLVWWTPLRHGRVPVADITSIHPERGHDETDVIECRGRPGIRVGDTAEFALFVDEILRRRPDLPVELGIWSRLARKRGRT